MNNEYIENSNNNNNNNKKKNEIKAPKIPKIAVDAPTERLLSHKALNKFPPIPLIR